MTDKVKKAIEQLERISNSLASIGETVDYTDIAIQALEQQPCEDCISREETQNKINELIAEYIPLMSTGWTLPLNIAKTINKMPSVTPKTKWIPCSEIGGKDNGKI